MKPAFVPVRPPPPARDTRTLRTPPAHAREGPLHLARPAAALLAVARLALQHERLRPDAAQPGALQRRDRREDVLALRDVSGGGLLRHGGLCRRGLLLRRVGRALLRLSLCAGLAAGRELRRV